MARERFHFWRGLVLLLAAVTLALDLAAVLVVHQSPDLSSARKLALQSYIVMWLPIGVLGGLVALRGVRTLSTLMLATCFILASCSNAVANIAIGAPGFAPNAVAIAEAVVSFLAAGAYLRSTQLFPRSLTAADLSGPNAPWRRLPVLSRLLAALLRPWAAWAVTGLWLLSSQWPVSGAVGHFSFVGLGAVYWYVQYRIGTAKARRRVVWFLQTAVSFAVLALAAAGVGALVRTAGAPFLLPYVVIGYNFLLAIAMGGSIAMAVFGAGAVNPALVLRATVIYGAAVALLLFALNLILSVLIDSAVEALGLSDRIVAATLGTLAGLLIEPIVVRLRKLLERIGPRSGADGVAQSR